MSESIVNSDIPLEGMVPGVAPVQADTLFGTAPAVAQPLEPTPVQAPAVNVPTSDWGAAVASSLAEATTPTGQPMIPSFSAMENPLSLRDENDEYDELEEDDELDEDDEDDYDEYAFMQNRELSWLTFNERVLDQGADESVPLLERLNFISIFWSNLQEFFMVRVGSLTDLSFIEPPVKDSKTGMTPKEQIKAIHERCRELYPIQESYYEHVRGSLAKEGVRHLRPDDLSDEQRNYLSGMVKYNIEPFLSPQIINPRHPFPHLENGKLYILVRLDDDPDGASKKKKKDKKAKKEKKDKGGAEGVVLGLIPLPHQCERVIKLPGRGFQFILLEHAIEMFAPEIFSMYTIKHTNVICVTRNADIDANQTGDEQDEDYREHMKRLLKQRARLAPVRLECERPLSPVMEKHLLKKLGLKRGQVYDTIVPLDLSFTWGLGSRLSESKCAKLSNPPFTPAWPTAFDRKRRIMDQVAEKEVLLSYPYESMDPFVQLLKEAAFDPSVVSIKITLYRLASQSQLAEALITAAENGKDVTALFELRARFDESNNIEWSQRFEQAGCNVIYGFRDYKVHSKICCITRRLPDGSIQHITQLGTGNYNEKTAKLYTDLSFITTSEAFGRDAVEFFRNMQLENVSDNYEVLCVAPLQIKPMILQNLDRQIALARQGKPCGAFLKANSVTDKDVIEKIAEASQAGVGVTLFVRGICCIVPELKGLTDNVRVVSIVGRLLEHSRIYCFGTPDDCTMYLSSADLMTRNLNKRVEIAWPILNADIRNRILDYINVCLHDTAKLRELRPNKTYTPLGAFCELDEEGNAQPPFDAQAALIEHARVAYEQVEAESESRHAVIENLPSTLEGDAAANIAAPASMPSGQAGGVASVGMPAAAVDQPLQFAQPGQGFAVEQMPTFPQEQPAFEAPVAQPVEQVTPALQEMPFEQAMPNFQPVEQPAPDFTPADQAIPEMQQPSFQQGPVPFVEQAIPAFPQDAQPVEQMAPEFQEQPTISQESMLPVEQAMPFFQDQPSGQSDYLQQAVRGDDAVMPELQEPAFAEPIVQPVGQVQPYAPEAAGIEFAPEVQMPADQADFSAQPTSFMPTIGQEEAIPFGQPTQVMEPVSAAQFEQPTQIMEPVAAAQFEQPTQFMEPVPDMSVEQVEAAKQPAYAEQQPAAQDVAQIAFQPVDAQSAVFGQQLAQPEFADQMAPQQMQFQGNPALDGLPQSQPIPMAFPGQDIAFPQIPGDAGMPAPAQFGAEGAFAPMQAAQSVPQAAPEAGAVSAQQEASLTDLTIADILMPQSQPEQHSYVPVEDAQASTASAYGQRQYAAFSEQGGASQYADQPMRISFDSVQGDEPLRIALDDSYYQQPSQPEPQPMQQTNSGMPMPSAQSQGGADSFIDEDHRQIDMPPQKGFFSRFRKR